MSAMSIRGVVAGELERPGRLAGPEAPEPSESTESAPSLPPRAAGADVSMPARAERRDGALLRVEDCDAEPSALEPEAPADPVVSANATGIAPAAEPIPNATANAPTRPTYWSA